MRPGNDEDVTRVHVLGCAEPRWGHKCVDVAPARHLLEWRDWTSNGSAAHSGIACIYFSFIRGVPILTVSSSS
jgi:hypothetical protein